MCDSKFALHCLCDFFCNTLNNFNIDFRLNFLAYFVLKLAFQLMQQIRQLTFSVGAKAGNLGFLKCQMISGSLLMTGPHSIRPFRLLGLEKTVGYQANNIIMIFGEFFQAAAHPRNSFRGIVFNH